MKLTLKQLRKLIREALLTEATCPRCGDPNAYVGFSDVECPNPSCPLFSQRQADEIKAEKAKTKSKSKKHDPRLQKLLDYAGLYGLDNELDEISYNGIQVLENDYGFERMGDNGVGTGDVVSPKHWRVIPDISSAANPDDVVEAGSYDTIYWEAVSPEAKKLARAANSNIDQDIGEFFDQNNELRELDRAHVWQIQQNKPEPPFNQEEINEILGAEPDYY